MASSGLGIDIDTSMGMGIGMMMAGYDLWGKSIACAGLALRAGRQNEVE